MKKTFILFMSAAIIISSCRKKGTDEEVKVGGCTDIDSPQYKSGMDFDDGSCKYAYATDVEILHFPEKNNGSSWDDLGGKADIYLKLKPVSETSYDDFFNSYSDRKNNASHDEVNSWATTNQFQLTYEDWYWELLDEDNFLGGSDDKIASGIVNPIKKASKSDNWVIFTSENGETQIKVKYILQ